MKTINYTVEPAEKKTIDAAFYSISERINTYEDHLFLIKKRGEVLGFASFIPIKNKGKNVKALFIKNLICSDTSSESILLKESMMYLWEAGYHAVFTYTSDKAIKEAGFKLINTNCCTLPFEETQVFGFSLSWNGLAKYVKEKSIA